jgi:hypothetical protein
MVVRHLGQGITGTYPPALLDENPYTGSFSPREWVEYFHVQLLRQARRHFLSSPAPDSFEELALFLEDSADSMPTMRPREAALGFLAYVALACALIALMFAVAHVPAAASALSVFMD